MRLTVLQVLAVLGLFEFAVSRRVTILEKVEHSDIDKRGNAGKRDGRRLPINIDNALDLDSELAKRDAKRLALDAKNLKNVIDLAGEDFSKRDLTRPQYVMEIIGGKNEDRVNLDSRITLLHDISLFSEYGRDVDDFATQLEDSNQELLVIAPSNEAITKLSMKPWQFPKDIEALENSNADAQVIDEAIKENVSKFVKSHVVAHSNDFTLESSEIWLHSEADTSEKGDIVVKRVGDEYYVASAKNMEFELVKTVDVAANGVILVIDSCLSWPQ